MKCITGLLSAIAIFSSKNCDMLKMLHKTNFGQGVAEALRKFFLEGDDFDFYDGMLSEKQYPFMYVF